MGWFIVWIALCIVAAVIASNKGRSGFGFFLLAFFLSPLVGIIAALVAGPNTANIEQKHIDSGEQRKCPHCAELIKVDAKVCKHCGRDVPVSETKPCPHCGEPVKPDQMQCYGCERLLHV